MRRKPIVLSVLVSTTALVGALAGCSSADRPQGASTAASSSAGSTVTDPAMDPATWTNERLAAQLVFAGINMNELSYAKPLARIGVGGVVLFGTPTSSLKPGLTELRNAAPAGHLLISSDEEGGLVQRLTALLGRLPSAKEMAATKTPQQVEQVAASYGTKMKELGVNVNLAPVADLAVPGFFIAKDGRSFGKDPETVIKYTASWITGMEDAGVMPVIKHWPGHGSASDSHVKEARTPSWSVLKDRDAATFRAAFEKGVPAVMVGHLIVPGLTEANTPATVSKMALETVRNEGGPGLLIMTDSLSMAAVTTDLHQTQKQAALRSLIAGSDMVLLQDTDMASVIGAITEAISSGRYPKGQAIESAKRVLAAQVKWS